MGCMSEMTVGLWCCGSLVGRDCSVGDNGRFDVGNVREGKWLSHLYT